MSTEKPIRRTKIICTIGPATASFEMLEQLALARGLALEHHLPTPLSFFSSKLALARKQQARG